MTNRFNPEVFFDLNNTEYSEIFKDINFVWEILPNIESFIKQIQN